MKESESKQWSAAEGVSGSGWRRGEWGVQGADGGWVSVSQGLSVSCYWDEVEVRVCESARTQAGC